MEKTHISRLVRASDLNHHGTLFAGQTAKWMVEACFVAAAKTNKNTENIVCVNIEGLQFKRPVQNGDIIDIITFPAYAGKSSLTVVGQVFTHNYGDECILDTAVTFVILDKGGSPAPHGIVVPCPEDEGDRKYWERFDRKHKKRKNLSR